MTERIGIPEAVLENPRVCANYFNNWHSNLPGGSRRKYYYEDMIDEPNLDPEHRQGKTEREFWDVIDQVLTECRIDHEQVSRKVNEFNQKLTEDLDFVRENLEMPSSSTSDALLLELHRLTAPAFIRLKQQGFTHEDLTA